MVGNAADAALALTHPREFLLSDDGCSRVTYLIDGVVYKVNRGKFQDNEEEFHNANSIRAIMASFNVIVPPVAMFGDVLAMEYIDGMPTGECLSVYPDCDCPDVCIPDSLLANLTGFGWRDPAYGNAIWSNGLLYLVDLA